MIGTTVSHYMILAELCGGGMGVVYRAEERFLREGADEGLPELEKARAEYATIPGAKG